MVYFESLGSWWDASLSSIWRYLASDGHRTAHESTARGWTEEEVVPSTVHFDAERRWSGRWESYGGRRTWLAPVCVVDEELEGLLAGSRSVQLYSPAGERTRRDTYAEFASDLLEEAELAAVGASFLAAEEAEDARAVPWFAGGAAEVDGPLGVRLSDEGNLLAAPRAVVWAYLKDGRRHDRVHRGTRHPVYHSLGSGSFQFSCERRLDGQWLAETVRLRALEPLAVTAEWTAGPFAGSKMVSIYRPEGDATRLDVHGQFVSPLLNGTDLERAVRGSWDAEFAEDEEAIRRFASGR